MSSHGGEKTRWVRAHLAVLLAPTGHAVACDLRPPPFIGAMDLTGFRRRLVAGGPGGGAGDNTD